MPHLQIGEVKLIPNLLRKQAQKMKISRLSNLLIFVVYGWFRTHHCSHINRCVLNMDHYCPWLSNTIGFHNKKFFVMLLFYVCLTALSGVIGCLPHFLELIFKFINLENFSVRIWEIYSTDSFSENTRFTLFCTRIMMTKKLIFFNWLSI